MYQQPIFTEASDCKDCYKCIRECPVKAIEVRNDRAFVVDTLCIHCGHCVSICPSGAKKVRDGISRAKFILKNQKKVYVSLAPSYISEYGLYSNELITSLLKLGFTGVSETAHGAQEVSKHVSILLKEKKTGVLISSACPVVVEMIRKYYPQQTTAITPIMSPMLTHAKMLKHWYGNDISIVFIGPCIAKKAEADSNPGLIDVALTFKELDNWFKEENIHPLETNNNIPQKFIPYEAQNGVIYPIDGGMAETIKQEGKHSDCTFISFTGVKMIKKVLANLDEFNQSKPTFLELLACETGCINGPGMTGNNCMIEKHHLLKASYKNRMANVIKKEYKNNLNIKRDFYNIESIKENDFTPNTLKEALLSIGKKSISDELNCSGCGYDTCREFAKALLNKRAETSMCVSYMRMVAHNKAAILLQKIPSGVIIVDDQCKVVEMNSNFAHLLGPEAELCFDASPGMNGVDLGKIGSFSNLFKTALITGKEYYETPIVENGINLQLSIFNIQKHKLVTGIIQGVQQPRFQKEIVEKRTREVIKKNMETVQKIAFLLGENASFTDSLLNSILESETE
ncbi:MAG: 4Fe-4S binding protein [Marinilabiliaceae bacterium]|nr:4Fe-4S binding protein [Marinilabiliaceae bacterium]